MAGNIVWQSGAVQSFGLLLSGKGSQVNNATVFSLSGILDNTGASGGPGFVGLVELLCAQSGYGAAVAANSSVDLYLVPSRDGTNFPNVDLTGAVLPANSFKGSFLTAVSGNNQGRLALEAIPLLPIKYQGYIVNNLGQNLLSGWGVQISVFAEAYT